jgi:hypothetical protein
MKGTSKDGAPVGLAFLVAALNGKRYTVIVARLLTPRPAAYQWYVARKYATFAR